MESSIMLKQIVGMQKSAFFQSMNAIRTFQDQAENLTKALMSQNQWIPEEGQKTMEFWMQALRKGQEEFKKAVDQTYDNIESIAK